MMMSFHVLWHFRNHAIALYYPQERAQASRLQHLFWHATPQTTHATASHSLLLHSLRLQQSRQQQRSMLSCPMVAPHTQPQRLTAAPSQGLCCSRMLPTRDPPHQVRWLVHGLGVVPVCP